MSTFDFEALVRSVLAEHNRIRLDPQSYIPILEEVMTHFKDNVLYRPGYVPLQTEEGIEVYKEALEFLKKQRPVEALTSEDRLAKSAQDHVNDIGPKGNLTHDSSDGKTLSERIERYLEWDSSCGESIEVGGKTGQDVILSLLVDDGLKNRGHRLNLFKPEFKYVGISSGYHRDYEVLTVINYVGGLRELGKPFHDLKNYRYEYPPEIYSGFELNAPPQKEKKPKTAFQLSDPDAPDKTVSVKITKNTKLYEGRKVTVTKKFYTLEDGSQHIVEVEEF